MATLTASGVVSTPTLSGGAVQDSNFLIDGKPTVSLPATGSQLNIQLASPLNLELGKGHWTLEWSFQYDGPFDLSKYHTPLFLLNQDNSTGIVSLLGDGGFGQSLYYYQTPAGSPKNSWISEETKYTLTNKLMRCALVCRASTLAWYANGKLLKVHDYGVGQWQDTVPKQVTYDKIHRLLFGYWAAHLPNAPMHIGNVRISNYARYITEYTPVPF